MANSIKVSVLADVRDINRKLGTVNDQLSGFGKATKRIGGLIGAAFAGGAAIGGIKKMVTSASDLNETISKTQTIFGKSSPAIMKWADNAAKSLGLSKQAALDGVSTFGNFFNQIGIGAKETESISKSFVQAAVDLGSFHNAAPVEVMEALSAATRGEYDSLQKYIPTINAARVEQEALRKTGKASAKELTDQDKARAVSALVMKGQGKAAGDFARTQGSLANQSKILKARFENVTAELGMKLLPIATSVATFLNDKFAPAMKQVGQFITGTVVPGIKDAVNFFKQYQAIILPVVGGILAMVAAYKIYTGTVKAIMAVQKAWIAIQAALNVVMAANPIGIIILAIIGLATAFVIAYKKSETFRNIVNGVWNAIKTATVATINFVKNFVTGGWSAIRNAVSTAVRAVGNVVRSVWNAIKAVTSAVWNAIKAAVVNPVKAVVSIARSSFAAVRSALTNAWNAAKSATSNIWNGIKNAVTNAIGNLLDRVRSIKGRITGAFSGAKSWLYNAGVNVIQGLISGIGNMAKRAADAAVAVVSNAVKKARNALGIKSPSTVFKQIGRYTVQGLVLGLSNRSDLNRVKAAAGRMTDFIDDGFGTPSLAFNGGGAGSVSGNTYVTVQTSTFQNDVAIAKELARIINAGAAAGVKFA